MVATGKDEDRLADVVVIALSLLVAYRVLECERSGRERYLMKR